MFIYLGTVMLLLYNLSGFYFVQYETRTAARAAHHILFFAFSLLNTAALYFIGAAINSIPVVFILLFAFLMLEYIFIFKIELMVLFSCAATFVLHVLSARAISSSLLAIFYEAGIYEVQKCSFLRVHSLLIAFIIMIATFILYIRKFSREALQELYQNKGQISLLCAIEGVLLFYQILCSASYSLATNEIWFVIFHISSALLSMLWHYNLTDNTVKYSIWLNQSFKTDILTEQLNRQLNHYDAYEKQFEGFREFKHNYDKLIGNVRHSIAQGDIQNAQKLLQLAGENVQKLESRHVKYCNNMLVDSILWDAACAAQVKNVDFSAQISLPAWLCFSELEYCRIFENICTNALEAAQEAEKPAFISFTSNVSGPWLTIIQENSYLQTPKILKGNFVTSKKDPELHGVGIKSVRDILESHGGFGEIVLDDEKKTFKLIMHICRPHNK